jgi:hypothetical protein
MSMFPLLAAKYLVYCIYNHTTSEKSRNSLLFCFTQGIVVWYREVNKEEKN